MTSPSNIRELGAAHASQGLQGTVALPENGRRLEAELSDRVELVEIGGAGHALMPEQPELIAGTVLAFLRRLDGRPD